MTTDAEPKPEFGGAELTDAKWAAQLLDAFADRLKFEHDVISHRMGWLMTLNGFLVGGAAVLCANNEKFADHAFLVGALILICLMGAISNISCGYSNIWADRAIREAAFSLAKGWVGAGETTGRLIDLARLYGRDPDSFLDTKPDRFRARDVLHPWLLLPLMFLVVFCFASFHVGGLANERLSAWWLSLPLVLASAFLVSGIAVYFHAGKWLLAVLGVTGRSQSNLKSDWT